MRTAFREVEDALSDLATLSRQAEAVGRQLTGARDTATFAEELRIKEVPAIVPISIKTVRRRIQEGKLRSTKVGGIRLVRLRDVMEDLLGGATT